jgi:hypothetical protein
MYALRVVLLTKKVCRGVLSKYALEAGKKLAPERRIVSAVVVVGNAGRAVEFLAPASARAQSSIEENRKRDIAGEGRKGYRIGNGHTSWGSTM